jgi:hypothetical protein
MYPASKQTKASLILAMEVVMLLAVLIFSHNAFAYNLFGGRWPNQPHRGCCAQLSLYYSSGLKSYDKTGWQNGQNAWNASSANIVYLTTTDTSNPIYLQDGYYNNVSWDGVTYLYPCNSCTYSTANVVMNWYFTGRYSSVGSYSTGEIQSVAAHELGHLLGLAHNNLSSCVLMNGFTDQRWVQCQIKTPQSDDANGVNALY